MLSQTDVVRWLFIHEDELGSIVLKSLDELELCKTPAHTVSAVCGLPPPSLSLCLLRHFLCLCSLLKDVPALFSVARMRMRFYAATLTA